MQIFAYDKRRETVTTAQAQRKIDYFCPECQGIVRLRGGIHRRLHFFHFQDSKNCRLGKKSALHISTQLILQKKLLPYASFLEKAFPSIRRITDCLLPELNINFEIQCSPITVEEVEARMRDYKICGLTTVWILHDTCFNKKLLTPAEKFLQKHPHYYTNINEKGEGIFYDQFYIAENFIRKARTPLFPLQLSQPIWRKTKDIRSSWPLFFAGDLLNSTTGLSEIDKLSKLIKKENIFIKECQKLGRYLLKKIL